MTPPDTKTLIVPPQESPLRLDKFLIKEFPHTSRSYWNANLSGTVRVNGKPASKGIQVRGGETLWITPVPPLHPPGPRPNPDLKLQVLYQDADLLGIDKPAGIPCYPLKPEETRTVVNGVLALFPNQAQVDATSWEAGLVHRLDNDTSGVLILARSRPAKNSLHKMNREGKILKEYLVWVEGKLSGDGVIRDPIAHHPKNKKKMVIPKDEKEAKKLKARPAMSEYQGVQSEGEFSLCRVKITQGSRHQIRLHLASLGHPVVGDRLYGSRASAPRHMLHAHRVQLSHPISGKKLEIEAPPPEDFGPGR